MKKGFLQAAFTCFLLFAAFANAFAEDEKRLIVGYVEHISIPEVSLTLKAKLDTGATTSSIHANVIKLEENPSSEEDDSTEASKPYVIFSIVDSDKETKHLKKEIVRFVQIKTKDGGTLRRPVVKMGFCVAGQLIEEEVNLANRDHYVYDVLLGRNMMVKGHVVVDPSIKFTSKPNCMVPARTETGE